MKFDLWSLIIGILLGAFLLGGPLRSVVGKAKSAAT